MAELGKTVKKERPPEPGAPLWMCTFGDLMALLLCFFIMLFAISVIQEIKWEALLETLERRMGYSGRSPRESRDHLPAASLSSTPEESRRLGAQLGMQETPGPGGEFPSVQPIAPDGTVVRGGLIRFELGHAELTDQAKQDLEALLAQLQASRYKIMVKGHAAPTEADIGHYRRDFYLAYRRAVNVKEYLVSLGLAEEFFQVSMSDSTTIPRREILPEGTNPLEAGASVAVYLLSDTLR